MGRCSGSLKSALPKLTCQTSAPARSVFAMKAELLPAGPRTVAEMNSTSDVENSDFVQMLKVQRAQVSSSDRI